MQVFEGVFASEQLVLRKYSKSTEVYRSSLTSLGILLLPGSRKKKDSQAHISHPYDSFWTETSAPGKVCSYKGGK